VLCNESFAVKNLGAVKNLECCDSVTALFPTRLCRGAAVSAQASKLPCRPHSSALNLKSLNAAQRQSRCEGKAVTESPAGKEQAEPALPVIAMGSFPHIYRHAYFLHRAVPDSLPHVEEY
jgi:hypothetical protein